MTTMFTKILAIATLVGFFSGCVAAGADVEMPNNSGAGSDEMKASPCACVELPYDGRGFKWRNG